jgi:Asp-tRNA(Asn)/Glu-tRNA(Gln) amidotransferase A subunit family amidase
MVEGGGSNLIHQKSIQQIAKSLRESRVTPLQISNSFVSACESMKHINAWVTRIEDPEVIRSRLEAAPRGRLTGLLMGVKDVIATSEFPTRMGVSSEQWIGTTGGFDARIISKLRYEGAVIVGKNVTSEFAVHLPTSVANPRYPDSITGTSSSGSAAAVASGQVSVSIATQTAGSIARPASYCGVVGFKPSFGVFPRTGVLKTTERFDTVGLIGKRISDMKEVFSAGRINSRNHPVHFSGSQNKFHSIRVLTGSTIDEASEVLRSQLIDYGMEIAEKHHLNFIEHNLEFDYPNLKKAFLGMYSYDLSYFLRDELSRPGISELLRETAAGASFQSFDQSESLQIFSEWNRKISEEIDGTIMLSLAASTGAPKIDKITHTDANSFWTVAGLPQIVIPVLRDHDRKLVSVSLTSSKWSDQELLDFAEQIFPNDTTELPSI